MTAWPNATSLENDVAHWKKSYGEIYGFLIRLFKDTCPGNSDPDPVRIKLSALNGLYNTNVKATKHVLEIAGWICNSGDFDDRIQQGDPALVNDILRNASKEYRSFVSKYCHFSNPRMYPIFDGNVEAVLWHCTKLGGSLRLKSFTTKASLGDYAVFVRAIDEIKGLFSEKYERGFDYKDIDAILWSWGKRLKNQHTAARR